jgi:hypothetical protein
LSAYLAGKSQSLKQKNCGQLAPHVLVLSDSDREDGVVYAVIQGDLLYEVKSIIEGVDICLKSTFVFGLAYPTPARSSWTFIQRALFNLVTEEDIIVPNITELVDFVTK